MITQTSLGRLGQPIDIADAVALLVSDNAEWSTGLRAIKEFMQQLMETTKTIQAAWERQGATKDVVQFKEDRHRNQLLKEFSADEYSSILRHLHRPHQCR